MTSKPDGEREIYTPERLNREVRFHLEQGFPRVWVEGEVSNLFRAGSGHCYFTLKDARAQLKCALFRNRNPYGHIRIEDGQQVLVRGRLSLYEPKGEYQLICEHLEASGEGELRRQFEALKQRLAAEGLFSADRKRALPTFPTLIAVVTSPGGAAIRDVISVMERRYRALRVIIVPSAVQGERAAAGLRQALAAAVRIGPDVILLTRGGGSLEDLWAFNDEQLARELAACPIPTVCAVGHEIDFSIAEFVADRRAPTPSAAAELLVPDGADLLRRLSALERLVVQAGRRAVQAALQRTQHARLRLERAGPVTAIATWLGKVSDIAARRRRTMHAELRHLETRVLTARRRLVSLHPQPRLAETERARRSLTGRLVQLVRRRIDDDDRRRAALRERARLAALPAFESARLRLAAADKALHAVSPQAVLDRGYSVTTRSDGTVLRDADAVSAGELVRTRLSRGEIESEVR